ncbi:unnamed protein product [Scytosiphon promiscuus]
MEYRIRLFPVKMTFSGWVSGAWNTLRGRSRPNPFRVPFVSLSCQGPRTQRISYARRSRKFPTASPSPYPLSSTPRCRLQLREKRWWSGPQMSSSTAGLAISVKFSEPNSLSLLARRTTCTKRLFGKGSARGLPQLASTDTDESSESQEDDSQNSEPSPVTLWFINVARMISWKGSTPATHPHAVVPVADEGR